MSGVCMWHVAVASIGETRPSDLRLALALSTSFSASCQTDARAEKLSNFAHRPRAVPSPVEKKKGGEGRRFGVVE